MNPMICAPKPQTSNSSICVIDEGLVLVGRIPGAVQHAANGDDEPDDLRDTNKVIFNSTSILVTTEGLPWLTTPQAQYSTLPMAMMNPVSVCQTVQ